MPDDPNKPTDPQDSTNPNNQDNLEIVDPDDLKHQQSKPPSVVGEENVFSGDAPAEPADIDEELHKAGLTHDTGDSPPPPLGGNRFEEPEEE